MPADLESSIDAFLRAADRFFDIIHAYFRSQNEWLTADNLKAAIFEKAKPFGFTEQSFTVTVLPEGDDAAPVIVRNANAAAAVGVAPGEVERAGGVQRGIVV